MRLGSANVKEDKRKVVFIQTTESNLKALKLTRHF